LSQETRQQLAVVRLARGDDVAQLGAQLGHADRRTTVRAFRRPRRCRDDRQKRLDVSDA